MRKNIDTFEIYWQDEKVDPAAIIPPDANFVEFRRVTRRHSPERERGRGAHDPPPGAYVQAGPDIRHHPRVVDTDVLYVDYQTRLGQHRLEIELGDIDHAQTWDEVSVADVEVALQRCYPAVFAKANRVALAGNNRVLRDCENVARWQEDEIALQVIPQYPVGSSGQGPPVGQQAQAQTTQFMPEHHDHLQAEIQQKQASYVHGLPLPTQIMMWQMECRATQVQTKQLMLWWAGKRSGFLQIPTDCRWMTLGDLKHIIKQAYPRLLRHMLVGITGTIYQNDHEMVSAENVIFIPSGEFGGLNVDFGNLLKVT